MTHVAKPVHPHDPIQRLSKIQILVLDNSPQITDLFRDMLRELGFSKIFVANNGFQGVQILRQFEINLIITDWDLNVLQEASVKNGASNVISHQEILPLSGVDFVRKVRYFPNSRNAYIPIILFADAVERIEILKARDAGASEIILKPLSASELCKRIQYLVESPRMFVTANSYKGPCRRRTKQPAKVVVERRTRDVRIIKHSYS